MVPALLAGCAPSADEQSPFDFYVLSLSWSPSYCAIEGEDANRTQCGAHPAHALIVHGLWPQFEEGWPEFCDSAEPSRVPDALVDTMLDIMPSAGLVGHQWRKHGTCSGMDQQRYFETTRRARDAIEIPNRFTRVEQDAEISPEEAEGAFRAVNDGLAADGIAVTCRQGLLSEIRICLTRDLDFRACPEVDSRGCELDRMSFPPTGG